VFLSLYLNNPNNPNNPNFQVVLEPLIVNWLLTLFFASLPVNVMLRVWDLMFSEGVKIIFRASLTIFHLLKPHIIQAKDLGALMEVLENFNKVEIDSDQFVKTMFAHWLGNVNRAKITNLKIQSYEKLNNQSQSQREKLLARYMTLMTLI